jgi:hypothetical protein
MGKTAIRSGDPQKLGTWLRIAGCKFQVQIGVEIGIGIGIGIQKTDTDADPEKPEFATYNLYSTAARRCGSLCFYRPWGSTTTIREKLVEAGVAEAHPRFKLPRMDLNLESNIPKEPVLPGSSRTTYRISQSVLNHTRSH